MVSCKTAPKPVSRSPEEADRIRPALKEAGSGPLRAGSASVDANKQSDKAEAGARRPASSRSRGRAGQCLVLRTAPRPGRDTEGRTRKCQSSHENTREQSNETPLDVPPTPQQAPGRSGCPSETSIEVPERLRTSPPLAPRLRAAAARPSPHCSSSFPLETVHSARRKRLREEQGDRSCFQTREPRGQMDPLLKIPGAGCARGGGLCGPPCAAGSGTPLAWFFQGCRLRQPRPDRRGPRSLPPLPAPRSTCPWRTAKGSRSVCAAGTQRPLVDAAHSNRSGCGASLLPGRRRSPPPAQVTGPPQTSPGTVWVLS